VDVSGSAGDDSHNAIETGRNRRVLTVLKAQFQDDHGIQVCMETTNHHLSYLSRNNMVILTVVKKPLSG